MFARCFASISAAALLGSSAHAADAAHPTVIELFQSQGCSSCPPANANLNVLAGRGDVLALSFAVTYWDGLGWKDGFARPQYNARQWAYARAFGNAQVWTPQIVINGRSNIVGTQLQPLQDLIAKTDRGTSGPAVAIAGDKITISGSASAPSDVWLVRYDPRSVKVVIRAGENGGRTLPHRNIVHELIKIGTWNGGTASFGVPTARSPGLATGAFLQSGPGGPIIAAARG